jgi:ABC-type Fe3+ transport system permease subunit
MSRIGKDYRAYLFKPGTRRGVFDSFWTMIGVVAAVTLAGTGFYRLKDQNK